MVKNVTESNNCVCFPAGADPRFRPENIAANAKLVADVAKLAEERGLTAAQLSLAWVASQGVSAHLSRKKKDCQLVPVSIGIR